LRLCSLRCVRSAQVPFACVQTEAHHRPSVLLVIGEPSQRERIPQRICASCRHGHLCLGPRLLAARWKRWMFEEASRTNCGEIGEATRKKLRQLRVLVSLLVHLSAFHADVRHVAGHTGRVSTIAAALLRARSKQRELRNTQRTSNSDGERSDDCTSPVFMPCVAHHWALRLSLHGCSDVRVAEEARLFWGRWRSMQRMQ
jgi:hypothetical protein